MSDIIFPANALGEYKGIYSATDLILSLYKTIQEKGYVKLYWRVISLMAVWYGEIHEKMADFG
ncbi:MAG: hypothetical protein ACSLEL_05540 [Candidatus Malihini olakiniferum]